MTRPADPPELPGWRRDTPGCDRLIHLNNAGAALAPLPVREAVAAHLTLENEIGGYEASDARGAEIQEASAAVGRLLGAERRNVALTQNSTLGFSQAMLAFDFAPGDLILTSQADYVSNQLLYLALARRRGVELLRVPDAPEGGIDVDATRRLMARRRPTLVALTWVPTNSGLVQPAEAIGEICRDAEVPYLLDACQAVGQIPIDVARLHCDYLAGTARKFLRGPRGIGFLYVSDRALAAGAYPLTVDMRGATWTDPEAFILKADARRFESWEIAHALVLGLGAAVEYALEVGIEAVQARVRALAGYARERLAQIPGVRVLDRGPELCAIVTLDPGRRPAEDLKLALRARRINTSVTDREDALIDMDAKRVTASLRISPHYYNTAEEVDRVVEAVAEEL